MVEESWEKANGKREREVNEKWLRYSWVQVLMRDAVSVKVKTPQGSQTFPWKESPSGLNVNLGETALDLTLHSLKLSWCAETNCLCLSVDPIDNPGLLRCTWKTFSKFFAGLIRRP